MSSYRPGSPLREKSPFYRHTAEQQHAPLRNSPKRHQNYNEEEEYERRRTDELRKQMKNREVVEPSALARSSGYSSQQVSAINMFRQSKYINQDAYYTLAEREREREKPSATHFTLGPQPVDERSDPQPSQMPTYIVPNITAASAQMVVSQFAPPHVKEHISNIQSDNQSLMRRLNLVIQELERVTREKDDLYARLKQTAKDTTDIQRLLNGEDNVDKVNKYMQDDLAYERDRNLKVKSQIKELDLYKQDLIQQLRRLQEQQDDIAQDNQQLSYTLQLKQGKIQDVEKEHYFTQEKIKQVSRAIENLKADFLDENTDKTGLQRILNQMIQERTDLLDKLDLLAKKYDECVREITFDRGQMEDHNKHHAKLITAKIIFQQLEQMQLKRKAVGLSEIRTYCSFDNKCNSKLKQLAALMEKAAYHRLRNCLKQWHSNGLKSIGVREVSDGLSFKLASIGIKQKAFYRWRQAYQARIDQYDKKTRALQLIWQLSGKDSNVELKRAFTIWKEVLDRQRLQRIKVRKLIWRMYFNRTSAAMNAWINHASNVDTQVRLSLLAKEFSQKQYLTILFNNFKRESYNLKQKRLNTLFHCVKSWKDYLRYQKFLMSGNVLALRFRKNCDTSIVKACFDAFKQHKEEEKFIRSHQLLHEEELPLIEDLTAETEDITINSKFKAKSRACEAVKKCMAKTLNGYFSHWKELNYQYKEKLRTSLKDRIIKAYMETMRKNFFAWKTVHDQGKIEQHEMIVQEFQSDAQELTNEVIKIQKDLQHQQEQKDCTQKKSTLKCLTSYERRMKQLAIGRWRDSVTTINFKEDGAATIIKRLRLRFLRKAFDLYLSGVKSKKQEIVNEERCQVYKRTLAERTKKEIFQAWLQFKSNHQRAKKYWYRLYTNLDLGLKQQAIKRWRQASQKLLEIELEEKSNEIIDSIDNLNHQIGEHHIEETQQIMQIQDMKELMTSQARRIISNAFARYYYVNETRGFEKWKEFVTFEKQKERLLKKIGDRLRKNQFYLIKSVLQNWIQNTKINEKKDELKREEIKVTDTEFQLELQTQTYQRNQEQLTLEQDETVRQQKVYADRLQKSVQMIVSKVNGNHYTSQRRYIFIQWRQYVKREVNFIKCIQNVMQKSLWNKAFVEIRNFSREGRAQDRQETVLERFRMKFWKRTCGNAFSNWKAGAFSMIAENIQDVDSETALTIASYEEKKALFKEVNANRSEHMLGKHNLRNLFQSWKNVKELLKLQNAKSREFITAMNSFNKKCGIRKWLRRTKATKLAKLRVKKLTVEYKTSRLRTYFQAMKSHYQISKNLCKRLGNLASIHNQHALKLSLNAIQSFARAKEFAFQLRKEQASSSLEQILQGLLERKMREHLHELRRRAINKKRQEQAKSISILQNVYNKVRHHFQQWKNQAQLKSLAKEMHEEGPRREEIFEDRITLLNQREFLSKEGYDDREIEQGVNEELSRQKQLLLKGVRRIQHYNQQLYYKPKAFDRWRMFVQMRKLYRHWLNFVAKRGEFIKCDLHHAFDKWRNYYPDNYELLSKLKKWQLDRRIVRNGQSLENLADQVQSRENQIDNLNKHRDVLIENYIKGQKLAITLIVNHRKKSLHEAFQKWVKQVGMQRSTSSLGQLRNNVELIEQLKRRIAALEQDNDSISNENEELRQFSLDGFELAKNVQTLTGEREKLSVDLADKAQVIRKLLDENEKLSHKLRSAQDEAQKLIRSTMTGSTAFKTGYKSSLNYT